MVIETPGRNPALIAKQTFTMVAGAAANVTIELSGALLAQLEKAHTMKVQLTSDAKDFAKPLKNQTYEGQLTLNYG